MTRVELALRVAVLIASHGDARYEELARDRAWPSAVEAVRRAPGSTVVQAHRTDGTLAGVRNALAAEATGDWLCFLDADDELCPTYLVEMALALGLERTTPRVLLAPAVLYCEAGRPRGPAAIPNAGGWPGTNECVIGTLVQRRLFMQVGGFRELPSLEDYDLWLRCHRAGAAIVHVPDAVYVAHVNPAGRNADQTVYHRLREEHADLFRDAR